MSSKVVRVEVAGPVVDVMVGGVCREDVDAAVPPVQDIPSRIDEERERLERELAEVERLRSEMEEKTRRLAALIDAAVRAVDTLSAEHENDIVELSIRIAEKVLSHEITHGRYDIEQAIRSALQVARTGPRLTLRVNPVDVEAVGDAGRLADDGREVVVQPDETVAPGSFVVDSDYGRVLFDVEERLKRIRAGLLKGGGDGV